MSFRLVSLRSVTDFDPSKGGVLPQRIKLLGRGRHDTAKGLVILNETSDRMFEGFQKSLNWDRISGDFEHNTVPKSASYKGEPAPIACNATVELTADGLFADIVNWTPEGKHFVGGGHYQDISPAVVLNAEGEVVGLDSFGFCRKGATPDAILFSASFDPTTEARKPVTERQQQGPQDAEELLTALRDLTGSKPEASPTEVLRNLLTKISIENPTNPNPPDKSTMTPEQLKQLTDNTSTLNSLTAKVDTLLAGLTALTGDNGAITALSADLEAIKKQNTEGERQTILLTAAREGKVVPAETVKTLSNDQLRSLVTELPVTVPLHARTPVVLPLSATPGSSPEAGYDPEIAKQFGLTKEAYLAANKS